MDPKQMWMSRYYKPPPTLQLGDLFILLELRDEREINSYWEQLQIEIEVYEKRAQTQISSESSTPVQPENQAAYSALEDSAVFSCKTSSCRMLAGFHRMSLRLCTILVCWRILNRPKQSAKDDRLIILRKQRMYTSVEHDASAS